MHMTPVLQSSSQDPFCYDPPDEVYNRHFCTCTSGRKAKTPSIAQQSSDPMSPHPAEQAVRGQKIDAYASNWTRKEVFCDLGYT